MQISTDPHVKEKLDGIDTDYRSLMYREFKDEALHITRHYNGNAPLEVFVEAYSLLHMKRTLDKMPTPQSLRQKKSVGIKSGIKEILKVHYASVKISDSEEVMGEFYAPNGTKTTCDIQVIKILKALFIVSVGQNEQAQRGVMSVIPSVLRAVMSSSYLTVGNLLKTIEDRLSTAKDYYEKQVLLGIQEVLDDSLGPREDDDESKED